MRKSLPAIMIAVVSGYAAFSGCGGSDGSCGKVEPCGGSVVGSWKITSSCVNAAATLAGFCPQGSYDASGLKISGMATYNADMTYSQTETTSGSATIGLPPACLTMNGVTRTCAQYQTLIQAAMVANPDPTIQSVSCASAGTNCNCTAVTVSMTKTETGTYTIAGNAITTTPGDGSMPSTDDYCVQGTALHFMSVDMTMNMGPMGQASITDDVVLTKQ